MESPHFLYTGALKTTSKNIFYKPNKLFVYTVQFQNETELS